MLKLFLRIILILLVIIVLLAVYARFIEPYRLTATEVTINNSAVDITVAVFADTHFSNIYTPKDFEKVIDMINSKSPDIILFCGDLIDNYRTYTGDTEEIAKALARLSAPMGKFAVYGNHDHGGGAYGVYAYIMAAGGFQILKNETVEFDDIDLMLIGLDDFVLGSGNTEIVKSAADPDRFNLVFCHVPDIIDDFLEYDVDFMIAAHTHGGQVNIGQTNIPIYKHIFFPPYGQNYHMGIYNFENERQTTLYVNSGIATTQLPIRFMAPPEVTFIHLVLE